MVVRTLAENIAGHYATFSEVEAVVIAGSRTGTQSDSASDIDLYVYMQKPLSLTQRAELLAGSPRAELGNNFWEPGDEWIDAETGLSLDVMFRAVRWIKDQLQRVLVHHAASVGYTTCFWYNVLHSELLFDRAGWFRELQASAKLPYPPALKTAIIAKNFPILQSTHSSYIHQVELAIARGDQVSVNHRITAMLASYFDVLFAVNEMPHPGEKRLVDFATTQCGKLPQGMANDVNALLASLPKMDSSIVRTSTRLIVGLEGLLRKEHAAPGQ